MSNIKPFNNKKIVYIQAPPTGNTSKVRANNLITEASSWGKTVMKIIYIFFMIICVIIVILGISQILEKPYDKPITAINMDNTHVSYNDSCEIPVYIPSDIEPGKKITVYVRSDAKLDECNPSLKASYDEQNKSNGIKMLIFGIILSFIVHLLYRTATKSKLATTIVGGRAAFNLAGSIV